MALVPAASVSGRVVDEKKKAVAGATVRLTGEALGRARFARGAGAAMPVPAGESGFLHEFLAKRGEGAHHMTFIVRDVRHAVARARAAGLRVVDEDYREPRWQEAFISPRSAFGTIIQLAQTNMSVAERERHWSVADVSS